MWTRVFPTPGPEVPQGITLSLCLLIALTLGSQSRQAPLLHRPLQSWCLQGSPLFPSHTEIVSLKSSSPLAFRDPVPFGSGVRCVVCVPGYDCSEEGSRSFYLRRWAVVVFTWYVSAWESQILVLVFFLFLEFLRRRCTRTVTGGENKTAVLDPSTLMQALWDLRPKHRACSCLPPSPPHPKELQVYLLLCISC